MTKTATEFEKFMAAGGSFGAFNRAAIKRTEEMTAERRQADIEEGRIPYGE